MRALKFFLGFLLFFSLCRSAHAQFVGIGGGRLFPQNLVSSSNGGPAGAARSESETGGLIALDFGLRWFPSVTAGGHYSAATTDLRIARSDAFGSSADVELSARTVTFDTRFRTPFLFSFRLFGLSGVGITRFGLDVRREVENPFPGGVPDGITSFVFTYGGGVERHLHQLVHLRLEVRDYLTRAPQQLFAPGGAWHRLAVIGGITIGL